MGHLYINAFDKKHKVYLMSFFKVLKSARNAFLNITICVFTILASALVFTAKTRSYDHFLKINCITICISHYKYFK